MSAVAESPVTAIARAALTFQETLFALQRFWAERGCVLQQPYDIEVGAGTMSPDTFLRVCWDQSRFESPTRSPRAARPMAATATIPIDSTNTPSSR